MNCIICDKENEAKSIEHIVSESFGNKTYSVERNAVCDVCNSRFSKAEKKALSHSIFVMERARLGIAAKSGKSAKGQIGDLQIEGHPEFIKNRVGLKGLESKDLINHNPEKNTYDIVVPSFDKSEDGTSKLLLKMGLESLYKSKKSIFAKYNFTESKNFLTDKNNSDWPFITCQYSHPNFHSIPTYTDKYLLNNIYCKLLYQEFDEDTLLFKFKYGAIEMMINLLNRNIQWIQYHLQFGNSPSLYPKYYLKKLIKK